MPWCIGALVLIRIGALAHGCPVPLCIGPLVHGCTSAWCIGAVAQCIYEKSGAAIHVGNQLQESIVQDVSAGDKLRVELDRTDLFAAPLMRFKVNDVAAGKLPLPAGWEDLCFAVQFFDHADEVVITFEKFRWTCDCNSVSARMTSPYGRGCEVRRGLKYYFFLGQ